MFTKLKPYRYTLKSYLTDILHQWDRYERKAQLRVGTKIWSRGENCWKTFLFMIATRPGTAPQMVKLKPLPFYRNTFRTMLYRPEPYHPVPVETCLIRASLHCRWGTLFAIDISLYCLCRLESAANHPVPLPLSL